MKKIFFAFILLLTANIAPAQSLKDMFNKDNIKDALGGVVDELTNKEINVEGEWLFEESAIEFESDDLLKKAGGALAASQLKEKMNEALEKIGITKGSIEYKFDATNFSAQMGKIPSRGTYTIDQENKTMTMSYAGNLIKSECKVKCSGDKLTLLFKADKLIEIVSLIAGKTDTASLKTISNLLNGYDGCNIGFDMTRK